MARLEPDKLWWTADDLAGSGLPMLPGTKQAVNAMVKRGGWRAAPGCARRKPGRGGGWQYHWSVLPEEARRVLLTRQIEVEKSRADANDAWEAFDGLKETAKAKAKERLEAIRLVEALHDTGNTHVASVDAVARRYKVSARTIYNWWAMVEGVAESDRLAYLVPRNQLVKRTRRNKADVRAFMDHLKSDFLRLEGPAFTDCYRDAVAEAVKQGWEYLRERTAKRRLDAEVPRVTRVFAREGEKGLRRCFPAQIRDRSGLHALEGVNADCHKIDVFVRWPDGTVDRPQIVGFQDLYSNKILSWRVDHDPNKVMVMSAFGEMIEKWGIPSHCLFDNGHEFANKWMTAGAPTRFRFKVREGDPLGVLPLLGIKMHWATPAHGQAKPIERGFRDFASSIAKDIRFAGAYVGNKPTAKPENYGSRAVPLEDFMRVVDQGITEHNARDGRLSATANGRSFDATFEDSFKTARIRKATEEQRRLWMMGQHVGKLNSNDGQIRIHGNFYYADWMSQHAGRKVVARFDPEDLHAEVFIYDPDGTFLGQAECREKIGFFDLVGARETSRRNARIKRAEKALVKAHAPVPIDELAARKNARAPEPAEPLEAKIVAPVFGTRRATSNPHSPLYEAPDNPDIDQAQEALILQMSVPKDTPKPAAESAAIDMSTPRARFMWALSIIARSDAGQEVGTEEARRYREYVKSSEYESQMGMYRAFGEDGVG
ncbi:transposase domain-containing protein [Roseobacter sp. OBYS 0001]|uniref:transposase domain-containing protein n=1 Tax=Roseobacter sp. OBYS 0001 TaxID=882651 RepID=UPI001BC0B769|nr:transposase domain-containing protein [Roseobacter sp. OBYS 0001]GIT85438.1 transposase [Roseobacter sp. OBYS 0001]